ncbi:MAG: tetratricopeptide repeat protein, partial [Deltaproteobacteria bacterium]|nr:tetratricopeptide repeat protein [Deltaproteobacteria bacterium]
FLVLEPLGRGGMGLVYAAYDDKLDRKVAVKIVLPSEFIDQKARLRFQREAQALARLAHPNVVTVHEIGESDGEFYLAMEYIRGQSVDAWLGTAPQWSEILDVFVQAGRGLMAAHRAELVHRDLKPANIMRSDDGVAKVVDFGLARSTTEFLETSDAFTSTGPSSALSSQLTRTDVVVGTPPYMAPEQSDGSTIDARSDQYSFCVALWEALTGARPFDGTTTIELLEAKLAGAPQWPDGAPKLPRTIIDALRRGLDAVPDKRWPSMDVLLQKLSMNPRHRRNRWAMGLVGVGVLGLCGVTTQAWLDVPSAKCSGAEQHLAGIWDDARRAEVETAIVASGPSYAQGVWERTQDDLDHYTEAWRGAHVEACEATVVRAEQSPRILDLRMQCLQRAARQLHATVDTLAAADMGVVSQAHRLVADLQPLSRCEDIDALKTEVEPPLHKDAESVAAARRHVARAKSLRAARRYEAAQVAVVTARDLLEDIDYVPVRVELTLEQGKVLAGLGEYDEAERALEEAVEYASRLNQQGLLADTTNALMHHLGSLQRRPHEAMLLRPLVLGSSNGDPARHGRARYGIATVLAERGEFAEAAAEYRKALALQSEAFDRRHPTVAGTRSSLGRVLLAMGDYDAAEVEFRAALEVRVEALGLDHPDIASSRHDLAMLHFSRANYESAEAEFRAALTIRIEAQGPSHPSVARSRNNLGAVLRKVGEYEAAEAEFRHAWAIQSEVLGPDHRDAISSRINVAVTQMERNQLEAAEAELRSVLELELEMLGPKHPDVALVRHNLGFALVQQGKIDQAEAQYREALAVRIEALGADHPDVAFQRTNLGQLLVEQGKYEEAEAQHRLALASRIQVLGPDHPDVADSRKNLGAALRAQGKQTQTLVALQQ